MAETFLDLLRRGAPYSDVAAASDAMDPAARIVEMRRMSKGDLAKLFALAKTGLHAVGLEFFVPRDTAPGHTVDWPGKNSLPTFNHFSKRFTRSRRPTQLVGHNTGGAQVFVGPGYFMTEPCLAIPGEFVMDYTQYPEEAPRGWPQLAHNDGLISGLVFGHMHDYVRPVGNHLAIGAAFSDQGAFRNQYFALARGETLDVGN